MILYLTLTCCYLSSLRPSGAIFSLTILSIFIYKIIARCFKSGEIEKSFLKSFLIILLGFIFSYYNLQLSKNYISYTISTFSQEPGTFFGYPREKIRITLSAMMNNDLISNLKSHIYLSLWKITDFISGISDIRDTHKAFEREALSPFIFRVWIGIFYL